MLPLQYSFYNVTFVYIVELFLVLAAIGYYRFVKIRWKFWTEVQLTFT